MPLVAVVVIIDTVMPLCAIVVFIETNGRSQRGVAHPCPAP